MTPITNNTAPIPMSDMTFIANDMTPSARDMTHIACYMTAIAGDMLFIGRSRKYIYLFYFTSYSNKMCPLTNPSWLSVYYVDNVILYKFKIGIEGTKSKLYML